MVQFSRRQFMKVTGSTLAGSSLALMGFSPTAALAEVRQYKLSATTVTRQTCTYCSVGCGILMYSLGDGVKNAKLSVMHVEGDPDHPVNRGTLCPKGASLLDFVHSPHRLTTPLLRKNDKLEPVSWEEALNYTAKRLAEIKRDHGPDSIAALSSARCTNEENYLLQKFMRAVIGTNSVDHCART